MYLVTAKEMREIDKGTIEKIGIPSEVLMENAGIAVANRIKDLLNKKLCSKVIILSGTGNNGGDGFVVARHLGNAGYDVETWLIGDRDKLSRESEIHLNSLINSGYKVEIFQEKMFDILKEQMSNTDVIVDALVGIGVNGPLRNPKKEIIDFANTLNKFKVAIDIPSGVNCDTGQIENSAFLAKITVTFAFPKLGLLLYPGVDYVGELIVEDISIPPNIIEEAFLLKKLITDKIVKNILPIRAKNTHKGSYGHALIIGGSSDMPGAPTLAASAALRIGAGLVTVGIPKSLQAMVFSYLPESICKGLPEELSGHLAQEGIEILLSKDNKYDAICYGIGVGLWKDGYSLLEKIINLSKTPLVIDADGLNALSNNLDILRGRDYPIILTPHPGEMSRLVKESVKNIEKNRVIVAQNLAREYGVYVVLKGANTIIATPEGEIFINQIGGPELAKGGTGDVLSGMITGMVSQGIPIKESLIASVYLHGLAGLLVAKNSTNYSVLATDVIENIGPAIYQLISKKMDQGCLLPKQ